MNIDADWDNDEQTIIRFLYRRSNWEWNDFYAALEVARTLIDSAVEQVGFIVDVSNASLTPGIFMSQSKLLYEIKTYPKVSLVIVIGADRFIEALYAASMAGTAIEDQFYFANTRDDAHVILDMVNLLPPVNRIPEALRMLPRPTNIEPP